MRFGAECNFVSGMNRLEALRSDSAALVSTILAIIATYYLTHGGISTRSAPFYAITVVLWTWLAIICYNFSKKPVGVFSRILIVEVAALIMGGLIYIALPTSFEGGIVSSIIEVASGLIFILIPISVFIWLLKTLRLRFGDSLSGVLQSS